MDGGGQNTRQHGLPLAEGGREGGEVFALLRSFLLTSWSACKRAGNPNLATLVTRQSRMAGTARRRPRVVPGGAVASARRP